MNMTRAVTVSLGASLLFLQAGCCVGTTAVSLRELRCPGQELRKEFQAESTNTILARGVYLGEIQDGRRKYSRYQFTNVLAASETRVLEILVAEDKDCECSIREAKRAENGIGPAVLFSHNIDYNDGLYPLAGDYCQKYYPEQNATNDLGRAMQVFILDDGFVHVLRRHPDTGEIVWGIRMADVDLGWVVRSRAKYCLGHLKYLYAVPLDIISSPLQPFAFWRLNYG